MLSPRLLALAFAIAPSLVSAALFPSDSLVKLVDENGFRKAMKANGTIMVAFVAPWCGHCQKMAPEYSKAALNLHPLIPLYAVDCDAEKNKRLCAQQGVQGFPTVKLFPRGKILPPVLYESERTASGFWHFATKGVPQAFTRLLYDHDISPWVEKHQNKHRVLLLNKDKNPSLLWKILTNKYQGQFEFGTHRDRNGKTSAILGLEVGEKKGSQVLLFPAGSTNFVHFQGINKLDSLSKFLDSVLDGSADFSSVLEQTKVEEVVLDENELKIERNQEAQRIASLHSGHTDIPEHLKKPSDVNTATTVTAPTTTGLTSSGKPERTATPLTAQEDETTEKPVPAPESIKVAEPVVDDEKKDAENSPAGEEIISEQANLESDAVDEASPAGSQCKGQSAESVSAGEGASGKCPAPSERLKDEL